MARKKKKGSILIQTSRRNRSLAKCRQRIKTLSKLPKCGGKKSTLFNRKSIKAKSKLKRATEPVSNSSSITSSGCSKKERYCGDMQKEPYCGDKQREPYCGDKELEPYCGDKQKEPYYGDEQKESYCGDKQKQSYWGEEQKEPYCGDEQEELYYGDEQKQSYYGDKQKELYCGEQQTFQDMDHEDFLGSLALKPVFRQADPCANCVEMSKNKEDQEERGNDGLKEDVTTRSNFDQDLTVLISSTHHNCNTTSLDMTENTPQSSPKDIESIFQRLKLTHNSEHGSVFGVGTDPKTFSHEIVEERIIQRVQQMEKSYKHELNSSRYLENTCKTEDTTLIIFRDNNKKLKIHSDGTAHHENMPNVLFDALETKRKGQKRRYAKLMKKLEDTEKSLETNLKGIMELETEDKTGKINVSACIDKVKKKLCVRAKKKYESLINYQRIKANVEQKSFEDLLPEKADLVKSNIEKEIAGGKTEEVRRVSKPRGRPRKIPGSLTVTKKVKDKCCHSTKKSQANEASALKECPRNSPCSLLQDSNTTSVVKADKIRLGIIDKNGAKEVIELSNETLKRANLNNKRDIKQSELFNAGDQSSEDQSVKRSEDSHQEALDDKADNSKGPSGPTPSSNMDDKRKLKSLHSALGSDSMGESWLTSPPTTIRLPAITSLESDYQLVSLSASQHKKIGDFRRDQFFIPQSTFSRDGKKGMVIIGPFCVSYTPKPHLVLVPPKDHQKKEPMILKRKVVPPAKVPVYGESEMTNESGPFVSSSERDKVQFKEHDYCLPLFLQDAARQSAKDLARRNAMTRFIDARVEYIEQSQGNSVVTIKGDNILKQAPVPISTNKDGIPVVYNLTQITTPVLRRTEERAKREQMAEESKRTADFTKVYYPLEAMGDVVMEVLIPPCGTEIVSKSRVKPSKGTEVLNTNLPPCSSSQTQSFKVIGSMPGKPLTTLPVSCRPGKEVNFLDDRSGHITLIDDEDPPQCQENVSSENNPARQDLVPIENESSLEGSPGLGCCRLCLRLFATAYSLFSHVRSIHSSGIAEDSVYLGELKARCKLPCPLCRPRVYFSTPLKLERHFQIYHSLDHPKEVCSYCFMEFSDIQELLIHFQMAHGIYTGVNPSCAAVPRYFKLKSQHGNMNSLKCKRSLLSDYLTCSRCNIMFDDRNSLVSHTLTVHPDLNQVNVCRLCEREFDTDSALRKHLRHSHEQTQSGALRCPYCPAWLPNMDEASLHKVTLHSGAVPVHCPFCGAGYQNVHPMYNHVRAQHLVTESHLCPECQSSFPSTRLLTDHARREHLISARVIREHIRNVRSASSCCPFCTVSFTRTYDLAVHVVMNHKDPLLPAKCHFCMQSFVNPVIMKIHMAAAHDVHLDQHEDDREELMFLPEGMEGDDSVTVVLEAGEEDAYHDPASFTLPGKNLDYEMSDMRHALMMDPRDVLETQEAVSYIQNLEDDRDRETIVYMDDRNQVMSIPVGHDGPAGDMFDMSEGRLLDESLKAVDYLETLSNDRIAVAADVVADVIMDDIVASDRRLARGRVVQVDDMLGLNGQFEVDGVLYEFSAAQEDRAMDLQADDQINMDNNDLDHFLRQPVH